MNDDRLLSALKRLGSEEVPTASDRAIRRRLETAWTARRRSLPMPRFDVRRFAPVLAALAMLVAGFGGTALGAGADSPLWDTRVALEEAGAFLRLSNDDRVAYLLDLVRSRTEEAARQDAVGHPDAAAKARAAATAAVVELDGNIPQLDTTVPLPAPSPSSSTTPRPDNSASPSAAPTASGSPALQHPSAAPPTRTVGPTSTLARTETLRPGTPTPTTPPPTTRTATPSGTKQSETIVGTVRDPSGANVTNACISTSPNPVSSTSSCIVLTKSGSYGFGVQVAPGQTITLYAYFTSPTSGENFSGSATGTASTSSTTVMPSITLTLRR